MIGDGERREHGRGKPFGCGMRTAADVGSTTAGATASRPTILRTVSSHV